MGESIWDRVPVGAAKQREQTIAQCRKHMCGIALCRMPSVFSKCHIAHVMQRVLDRPMPAPQAFDRDCSGLRRRHTDQPIADLAAAFATLELDPFAFTSHDLLHIRPVHILDMRSTTHQLTGLQAPMALLGLRATCIPDLTVGGMGGQTEEQVQVLVQAGLVLLDDHLSRGHSGHGSVAQLYVGCAAHPA
jgi:hypothetical protein